MHYENKAGPAATRTASTRTRLANRAAQGVLRDMDRTTARLDRITEAVGRLKRENAALRKKAAELKAENEKLRELKAKPRPGQYRMRRMT